MTAKGKTRLSAARRRWLVDQFMRDFKVPERMVLAKRKALVKRLRRAGYGDDITSVCWLSLVESAARFDPTHGVKFSSYAFVNQVWRCTRLLERDRVFTARHDCERDDGEWFDTLPSRDPPPEREVERDDMGEFVRETVKGCITGHQWDTVEQHSGIGRERAKSMKEIARDTGVSYQAIQQTVAAAVDRVRSTVSPRVEAQLREGRGDA